VHQHRAEGGGRVSCDVREFAAAIYEQRSHIRLKDARGLDGPRELIGVGQTPQHLELHRVSFSLLSDQKAGKD